MIILSTCKSHGVLLSFGMALLLVGCGQKSPTAEQSLTEAVKTFEASNEVPSTAPATPPSAGTPAAPPVRQEMNQAVAAYNNGNYVDAVARLRALRSRQGISGQQLLAVQDAMASVVNEITARAAKGDVKAQQALTEYQRMQMAR